MPRIETELIAAVERSASEYELFPDLFVEPVNRHWLAGGRVVLRVMLQQQDHARPQWAELGRRITAEILAAGTYAGLCFDGDPSFDEQAERWVVATGDMVRRQGVSHGVVELKWIFSPHGSAAAGATATRPGRRSWRSTTPRGCGTFGRRSSATRSITGATAS